MRIGVVGDTHGKTEAIKKALEVMGEVDMIIHTGDYYRDSLKIGDAVKVPVHGVAGNCDYGGGWPEEKVLQVEGIILYITHGHLHKVHVSTDRLYSRAMELNARVAVYGHTHTPGMEHCPATGGGEEEMLLFNPGSASDPKGGNPTCGVLEIVDGDIHPCIYNI